MVIQVVIFNSEGITHEKYAVAAKEVAPTFKDLSGLSSKVWLSNEENNTYDGVYTWEDCQSMEDYLNSSFYDEVLGNNPAFVNITHKACEIIEEPTSITG